MKASTSRDCSFQELAAEVSQLKKANAQYRRREMMLESLLENIQGITYRCAMDPQWTMAYMSPHVDQLTGYPPEDFIDNRVRTFESIIHRNDTAYVEWAVRDAVQSDTSWEIEYRICHKKGHIVWVHEKGRAVYGSDGQIRYLDGFIISINDRKQAETDLRKSEERYREYFENNLSGSYISTPEGRLIACNNEYRNVFGFKSPQDALATPISAIFRDPGQRAAFLDRLKKEKRIIGYEFAYKKLDGTPIQVIENCSGVFDDAGELREIRGYLRDVTHVRRLENQLSHAHKMETIGTLAGGIAHDFNNILFPILGHTEILADDIPKDSAWQQSLDQIYTHALRAKDLVNQILTFARREKTSLRPVKIQFILKEVLKLLRSTIPTTIDIRHDIDRDCPTVKADPTQIHQVIMNLTANAYHAMEQGGGELTIRYRQAEPGTQPDHLAPAPYALLSVSDTGIGMTEDVRQKIFDPFFTTKEKGKGTGMGLSVVHGIVETMDGHILVDSKPEQGTRFDIWLPLVDAEAEARPETPRMESGLEGTERILLVDDETSILKMETLALERLGFQVTSADSPLEALDMFRLDPDRFDVVITDLAMPKMAGDQLCGQLLAIRPDLPVILLTGFGDRLTLASAREKGIRDILLKPVKIKELSKTIRKVVT